MKKRIMTLLVTMILLVGLSSCANLFDSSATDQRVKDVLDSIQDGDFELFQTQFLHEALELYDDKGQAAFADISSVYSGTFESMDMVSMSNISRIGTGDVKRKVDVEYTVTTSNETYTVTVAHYYMKDDRDGLVSFQIAIKAAGI